MTRTGRALLVVTGAVLVAKLAQRTGLRCWLRGYHDGRKAGLLPGGFRCVDCQEATDNGAGFVAPNRRVFDRTQNTITTTPYFEESSRGTH